MGADVAFHDPYVPQLAHDDVSLSSIELTATSVSTADCVVVTCDHSNIDYDLVLDNARIIVDPRNGLAGRTGRGLVYPIAGPARSPAPPATKNQARADVAVSSA